MAPPPGGAVGPLGGRKLFEGYIYFGRKITKYILVGALLD